MEDLAIVVNTNSNYEDLWLMFYNELYEHFPNHPKVYTFVDKPDDIKFSGYISVFSGHTIYYDKNQCFRDQYLSCIKQVPEKYCITMNEDYILYKDVDFDRVKYYINILESTEYSFIRFTSTDENHQFEYSSGLYHIPFYSNNLYSQTASIWKTRVLERIHEKGPQLHIASRGEKEGHFEEAANQICMYLGIEGLCHWCKEPKRGQAHYDNNVVPYVASALVKGKWNLLEYKKELEPLLEKYIINPYLRGIF
jgi:hypothetical protein